MYKGAAEAGASADAGGPASEPGASGSSKEDEVIDAEYVDSEKK